MPDPNQVNPHNFRVLEIIYSLNGFSIAWGLWQDGARSHSLAMRWDGDEVDTGYPNAFGHPVWFVLPAELTLPLLQAVGVNKQYFSPIQRNSTNQRTD